MYMKKTMSVWDMELLPKKNPSKFDLFSLEKFFHFYIEELMKYLVVQIFDTHSFENMFQ